MNNKCLAEMVQDPPEYPGQDKVRERDKDVKVKIAAREQAKDRAGVQVTAGETAGETAKAPNKLNPFMQLEYRIMF